MKKLVKKQKVIKNAAGPNSKALFTSICKDIETECHKILDAAASGRQDAMLCVMSGPFEVLHFATTKVEDKLRAQLNAAKAAK